MRISDWSSDVCSSDLGQPWGALMVGEEMLSQSHVDTLMPCKLSVSVQIFRHHRALDPSHIEIGEGPSGVRRLLDVVIGPQGIDHQVPGPTRAGPECLQLRHCLGGVATSKDLDRRTAVADQLRQQIGRASLRESVCQDVYFPVVALPLKKKTTQ